MDPNNVRVDKHETALVADPEAASCYRLVRITQVRREVL